MLAYCLETVPSSSFLFPPSLNGQSVTSLQQDFGTGCEISFDQLNIWNSPGQNTGVGSLFPLQGIFPNQGSNPGLAHCRWILYQLRHKGSRRILEWIAYPFPSGSFWPRNWTRVSCIADRFFTNWAIREAQLNVSECDMTKGFKSPFGNWACPLAFCHCHGKNTWSEFVGPRRKMSSSGNRTASPTQPQWQSEWPQLLQT